ncbi:hypothetical protein [Micromonospora sp. NPDC005299]|uniref:hypothetical protein n=1 Tax=Micromonospora sp. NPDC005299 TaxID=3364231 RepID=UPI003683B9C8
MDVPVLHHRIDSLVLRHQAPWSKQAKSLESEKCRSSGSHPIDPALDDVFSGFRR